MRVSATAKYIRRSTRKTRLVTQAIVGRPVEEATAILQFMPQGAARDVAKVLRSAAANAENNFDLNPDGLVVKRAFAGDARKLKRFKARSRGRVAPRVTRFSHIEIVVEGDEGF